MPERWQRELRRLRRAAPRSDLWTRVEEGPHGSRSRIPIPQRLLAGGVAFALFIAAGAFAWTVFRPAGTTVGGASVLSPGPSFTPSPAGTSGWSQYEDANDAVVVQVPDVWTLVSDPTPIVTDPRALFAVASFPIAAADPCEWFPAIPPDGALVWVEEWVDVSGLGGTPAEFPQKPAQITLAGDEPIVFDCGSNSGQQVYRIPFQQNGRYFWGQVAFGPTPAARTRAIAEQILTSFSSSTPTP